MIRLGHRSLWVERRRGGGRITPARDLDTGPDFWAESWFNSVAHPSADFTPSGASPEFHPRITYG